MQPALHHTHDLSENRSSSAASLHVLFTSSEGQIKTILAPSNQIKALHNVTKQVTCQSSKADAGLKMN